MTPQTIIFCTDGIFPHEVGGMQRHSALLIAQLANVPNLQLVVIHPHEQQLFSDLSSVTEVHISPVDKKKNYLLECYRYSRNVFDIIRGYPDDAIIYSQGLSVWYGITRIGKRVVVNPHGLEPYQAITFRDKLIGTPFRMIFNHLFRNAARVVSLGGRLTAILRSKVTDKSRIVVLPNAVKMPSVSVERDYKGPRLKLLFVARFAHNKGIHILLEAVRQLNEEGFKEKLEFNLGGKGPLYEEFRTSYNYPNVNYLGFVSDEQLAELYRSNDIFVFPTLFEGMPTVVLEAMSYGLPVIVSDVGATAELVNPDTGYLIRKNDVQELKRAILSFYELPAPEKKRLSQNAYAHVSANYTWQKVAHMHVQLFSELGSVLR